MNRKQNEKKRLIAVVLAVLLLLTAAVPALAETFSAIVTSSSMEVYRDAAMTKSLGTLGKYAVVQVVDYQGKAAKIQYSGRTGYASLNDMQSIESVGVKAVTNRTAKVYKSASTRSRSATVKAGTRLYVLKIAQGWAFVEKNGVTGYMSASVLTKADDDWQTPGPDATATPSPTPAQSAGLKGRVTASKLVVYKMASTSSDKVTTIQQGQIVNVLSWNNSWAYIEYDGMRGYCAVKGLEKATEDQDVTPTPTPASDEVVTVNVSKLPVYKKADVKSTRLATLKKGQTVHLVAVSGSWACVELNGKYGYCAAKGLSGIADPKPTPTVAPTATPSVADAARGTVTVSSLTVYRQASAGSEKVFTLKKGDLVNVLKWDSTWALVELDGKYGYCAVKGLSKTDVKPSALPSATPSTDNAIQATVTDSTLYVYANASDSAEIIGRLKRTQVVNVLSYTGTWAYIELAGNYGYCKRSGLSLDNKPAISGDFRVGGFTATVVQSGTRAYASPTTTADSVALALGQTVNVYAYSSEWACVVNGATYAFVPIDKLSRASYAAISESGTELQTLLKTLLTYGYYDGVPSSNYNSLATTAIKRFQAACGLEETGIADQTLQRILYAGHAPKSALLASAVSGSSTSADITRLQTRLYALGYLSKAASVDGSYGTTTTYAVGMFQKANGIEATGEADVGTLAAMYSTGAVSLPSGTKPADASGSGGSSGQSGVVTPPSSVKLSSTYVTTMPSQLKATISSYSSSYSNAQKLEHVIYSAQQKLGKPYVYGATGPNSFDCSGLTQYSFKKVSVSLKRSAYSQGYDNNYTKISGVSNLKRGDLVFFNTISDSDLSDHVGIYLGGGCFIHASSGGHKVVVSNITSGYYNRVFSWGRRVLK